MAVYVIGDVQGCFDDLQRLLNKINFKRNKDLLWFCGDLVNRGPQSLKTLEFVRNLGDRATSVLGNHDLHLLAVYYGNAKLRTADTLREILKHPECDDYMHWLRHRPLLHVDIDLNFALVHAGILPQWGLSEALKYSNEVEQAIRGKKTHRTYFKNMYGNLPDHWSTNLEGQDRLRFITNVFTRMRYCHPSGRLDMHTKGKPSAIKSRNISPWFDMDQKQIKHNRIVFGHWSTLPSKQYGICFAMDSGCLWGGALTALRIDKKKPRWYRVDCTKKQEIR